MLVERAHGKEKPGQEVNEWNRFHSRNPSHMPAVCKQNFDGRISVRVMAVYGKATRAWTVSASKFLGGFQSAGKMLCFLLWV